MYPSGSSKCFSYTLRNLSCAKKSLITIVNSNGNKTHKKFVISMILGGFTKGGGGGKVENNGLCRGRVWAALGCARLCVNHATTGVHG